MLIPKASHLVERVAERLLRSGNIDDPAAQLLRSAGDESGLHGASAATPTQLVMETPPPPLAAAPAERSSLFAPPPSQVRPVSALAGVTAPLGTAVGGMALGGFGLPGAGAPNAGDVPRPAQAAPGILGQPRPLGQAAGQAAVLERPADFAPSAEFRLVQRQILRSAFGPGAEPGFSNLLLVTSARPGEGKSFMSTNLSGSIARQGDHHVLLVDADSKRDSICYSLGLAQARGLLDLAANPKLDPSPLIVKTPIERLSILPVGRERERSAELFSTKEMTRLIQSLGRRYADRLLILDAPPCLSTSDPAVLSQVVGQILFVVEADRTQRDEIEASLDLIQACPTITMVLNKQQISSRYTFGAYSSYYSS